VIDILLNGNLQATRPTFGGGIGAVQRVGDPSGGLSVGVDFDYFLVGAPSPNPIPEPATLSVLAAAGVAVLRTRRR
jgi:hypothetical protein